MSLLALPNELISHILQISDAVSAIKCGMTCRRVYEVVQWPEVQYSIVLDVCEMADCGKNSASIPERLDRLRAYEQARRTLSWTDSLELACGDNELVNICGLQNGIFAMVSVPSGKSTTSVAVHRLPSKLRGVEHMRWTWEFPMACVAIKVDPSCDLAVLLRWNREPNSPGMRCFAYPRNLYTGEPHRLSAAPQIELPAGCLGFRVCGKRIIIADRSRYVPSVQILDWTTGVSHTASGARFFSDVALFGSNHLIIFTHEPPRLHIQKLGADDPVTSHVLTLLLPDATAGGRIELSSIGDHVPHEQREFPNTGLNGPLFVPALNRNKAPVVSFAAHLTFPPRGEEPWSLGSCQFDIPASYIADLIQEYSLVNQADGPVAISWDTLRAHGAILRLGLPDKTTNPNFGKYGLRISNVLSTPYSETALTLRVIDHSPLRSLRALGDGVKPIDIDDFKPVAVARENRDFAQPAAFRVGVDALEWLPPHQCGFVPRNRLSSRLVTFRSVPKEDGWSEQSTIASDDAVVMVRRKRENNTTRYKIVAYSF